MKKNLSKAIGIMAMTGIIGTTGVTAFAEDCTSNILEDQQSEIKSEIIKIISETSSNDKRNELLIALLEEKPLESTILTKTVDDTNKIEVVDIIKIDDNTQVDFYSTGDFGIMEIKKEEDFNALIRTNNTGTYKASYEIKNSMGGKIIDTYVRGNFTYDGSNTPTPYLVNTGYSKGTLVMWNCSSWKENVTRTTYNKEAFCYVNAYYDWTIDLKLSGSVSGTVGGVEGNVSGSISSGMTIRDCNVYLKLICDKYGNVYASVSLS